MFVYCNHCRISWSPDNGETYHPECGTLLERYAGPHLPPIDEIDTVFHQGEAARPGAWMLADWHTKEEQVAADAWKPARKPQGIAAHPHSPKGPSVS